MHILVDARISHEAKSILSAYGKIMPFYTEGITYEAISGHPDIFFCPSPNGLIVAPNLPAFYFDFLVSNKMPFIKGKLPVGKVYPETARYNALVTDSLIICNTAVCDSIIRQINPQHEIVHTKQGYIRCNLVSLTNQTYITSDRGIQKNLKAKNKQVLFVNASCVQLDGFEHGFFGGICGTVANKLFINGALHYFEEEIEIREMVSKAGMEIIELSDQQPKDIGTILFLE